MGAAPQFEISLLGTFRMLPVAKTLLFSSKRKMGYASEQELRSVFDAFTRWSLKWRELSGLITSEKLRPTVKFWVHPTTSTHSSSPHHGSHWECSGMASRIFGAGASTATVALSKVGT
jgi:hypothetical protein